MRKFVGEEEDSLVRKKASEIKKRRMDKDRRKNGCKKRLRLEGGKKNRVKLVSSGKTFLRCSFLFRFCWTSQYSETSGSVIPTLGFFSCGLMVFCRMRSSISCCRARCLRSCSSSLRRRSWYSRSSSSRRSCSRRSRSSRSV